MVFVEANDRYFMYIILCLFPGSSSDSTAQTANSPGVTIGVAIGCIAATLIITLGIVGLIFILYKKWSVLNKTFSPERHVHTYTLLFTLQHCDEFTYKLLCWTLAVLTGLGSV